MWWTAWFDPTRRNAEVAVDPTYGERYRELHNHHWWWRSREKLVLGELDRLRPEAGWRRALDVGCGDGLFFGQLRRYADVVEGVEPDSRLLSEDRSSDGSIHLRTFDATFDPGCRYDLMVFLDVLEHMEDPVAAVRHASTLMEEGGVVLVTVPAFRHLWTTHDALNHHLTRYRRAELFELLSAGFAVERARYFFRWVHPAKVAQRAMEALRRPAPQAPSLPPRFVNRALYALSRGEETLLGRVPIPVGSSLLAVARKRP
jgi:2-polyprenyl-3-methyl-5-hydroxy-6-metoxy-1,4-benzoquinol methylase